MVKPRWSRLILMSDGSSDMRIYRLSRLKTTVLTTALFITIGGLTYLSSRLLADRMTAAAMASVIAENNVLHQQLDYAKTRLDTISALISELYKSDDQLRTVADLPHLDSDIRQVGVGGGVIPSDWLAEDDEMRRLMLDLDKMEREVKLQKSSYAEIERQLMKNRDIAARTPSIRPVDGGFISSNFGYRLDPFTGRRAMHNGIDISVERGTPVHATADGKVIFAKRTPGLGNLVIIDHGYGMRTAYGHLDRILAVKGQTITRWQKIGEVGSTGRSTAPHLHYEVHMENRAIDPLDYLFDAFAVNLVK